MQKKRSSSNEQTKDWQATQQNTQHACQKATHIVETEVVQDTHATKMARDTNDNSQDIPLDEVQNFKMRTKGVLFLQRFQMLIIMFKNHLEWFL